MPSSTSSAVAATSSNPNASFLPPPSIGHEIGVAFGFIGAMVLAMTLYGFAWQIGNRRAARKEAERIEALRASGWLKEKQAPVEIVRTEKVDEIPME